jgi:hypothetical protein
VYVWKNISVVKNATIGGACVVPYSGKFLRGPIFADKGLSAKIRPVK